jgi:hypothetical protein
VFFGLLRVLVFLDGEVGKELPPDFSTASI